MLKRDTDVLLVLFGTILVALGALGLAGKAGFTIAKKAALQITTSPEVKIDGRAAQPTTSPGVKTDGPAAR